MERRRVPNRSPSLRRGAIGVVLLASGFAGVYLLVSRLAGVGHMQSELGRADPAWLIFAGALELLSLSGYTALFGAVVARGVSQLGWRVIVQIQLAGIAALRLLATGGAGGFAVSAWALGQAGMPAGTIAARLVTNVVVQYAVYLGALVVCGIGLWTGLFPGGGSFAITVVPALLALAVMAGVASLAALPGARERTPAPTGERAAWPSKARSWLLNACATVRAGVRSALPLLAPPRPGLLTGALAYWGFDVAVLWCSFRAFGQPPVLTIVVMAYFVGTLADLLPLPGGIGGVDGGMIGVLLAFGVPGSRAVVAVFTYRALSFWLPTVPGVAGYLKLRATVRRWQDAPPELELAGPPSR